MEHKSLVSDVLNSYGQPWSRKRYSQKDYFYPHYPSFEEREDARERLMKTFPEVTQSVLNAFDSRFGDKDTLKVTRFNLHEFREFLTEIGMSKPDTIVYPQISGVSKYFQKHFGGTTLAFRLRKQIERGLNVTSN